MYLAEERMVDQWTSFFASLEATPNPTLAKKNIIAGRFDQLPPVSAFTPRLIRLGKRKAESPEPDQDSEFLFAESLFEMGIPKELLGPDKLADNVGIMSQHWKSLVCNMDTLLHLSQLTHRAGLDSQKKTKMDLVDLEIATSLVAMKVGDCPTTLGTDSLFSLVEDVVVNIGKLQESVATVESPELTAARELQLGFKIGKDIMGHLHPVFCLFGLFLRSKDAPGDILEERGFHALESWTNASPAQAPAAATGPAAWSFHQGPSKRAGDFNPHGQ
jgi:hypothetical protein